VRKLHAGSWADGLYSKATLHDEEGVVEVIAGLDDIMVAADSERGGGQERRGGGAVSGEGKGQHSTLRCTPTIAAIGGECRWLGAGNHERKMVALPQSGRRRSDRAADKRAPNGLIFI
jgi:hypothetical protein